MDKKVKGIPEIDCIIVGAGISGLYAIYRMAKAGFSVKCLEAGKDVGGVWYWNRYPGAGVDVLSRDYSYSFSEELQRTWRWSRHYSHQPEIFAYLQHVAETFDLREKITFETPVVSTHYDENRKKWLVTTKQGDQFFASYLLMACGHLSTPNIPAFPGMSSFKGETYHTGRWPHEPVDFVGKRVAVIGTGSSGVQIIPRIAPDVEQLFVMQRTAPFTLPIKNGPVDEAEEESLRENYPAYRRHIRENYPAAFFMHGTLSGSALAATHEERERVYEDLWAKGGPGFLRFSFDDIMKDLDANATAADFVRQKIAGIVKDPEVARKLMPQGYPIGTRRIALDDGYFEVFNRPNVELVDVKEAPIKQITETGIETADQSYDVDIIVFATGYDAFTGTLFKIDICGKGGERFRDKWAEFPTNNLGMMVSGFPNMFIIQGPGSPSVFANVLSSSEEQINWIARFIEHARDNAYVEIESEPEAEECWVAYCNEIVQGTLFQLADSWWSGANIPGKPKVFYAFVGGLGTYREKCAEVARNDYAGFRLTKMHDDPVEGTVSQLGLGA